MPPLLRKFFWFLNKFFMVPLFRLGLGSFFANPFSGYIMVMKTIGRKSGKVRYAPVNYTLYQGDIYCVSGGRKSSDWYRNLLATPDIEAILPGGAIYGHVEEIAGSPLRLIVIRQIFQNAGFAGFFEGYNPYRISDEELAVKSADMPLLRIRPTGLGNGAFDPAGWGWLLGGIISIILVWAVIS